MESQKKKRSSCARVKIISMGNAESGKSCIIKRYCERRFVHKYLATIGIDFGVTKVNLDGQELKINIFDMAGHPLFYEVRNEFYRDTQGAVLVYDVTDRSSFDALDDWLLELREEMMGTATSIDDVVIVVCANKIDSVSGSKSRVSMGGSRVREVDEVEGRIWAETRGYRYFETSAQSGLGICEMFEGGYQQGIQETGRALTSG